MVRWVRGIGHVDWLRYFVVAWLRLVADINIVNSNFNTQRNDRCDIELLSILNHLFAEVSLKKMNTDTGYDYPDG